ncbi:MAG: 3'-5' exonuclease, partial [Actinomycetota bacterium]|nr:3'-5' exonuclease [Actinomycetota bacterium]
AGLARREATTPGSASAPNLTALAGRLGVPVHRPHHAFGDALTTAEVFLALATRLEAAGAGLVDDLLLLGRPGRGARDSA